MLGVATKEFKDSNARRRRNAAIPRGKHRQSERTCRRTREVCHGEPRGRATRRSGQFSEVIEQVNVLDASIADEANDQIAMGSELKAVGLLNLGIVETWSGRLTDAERHLSAGAALAQTIGRPYLEVACRAHQGFPSKHVSLATARERGQQVSHPEELSPSELRVLRYLPTNLTRPEIARELYVSINTVNTHVRNIYSKLGARDRLSAIQCARRLRLLSTGRP
jgi:DNA-binding CsgD family transcriptional regulator